MDDDLFTLIPSLVSEEDNNLLLTSFFMEEANEATFAILVDSAAGVDGFSSAFSLNLGTLSGISLWRLPMNSHVRRIYRITLHACIVMILKITTRNLFRILGLSAFA